ncbi:MAG: CDP-diacylglycerol--glycerol-3-phosphate 3-phosphatidyltransferase [Gammaproteobacteria bacterium]
MYPQFNIATSLTWFRIAAVPLVAMVFYWSSPWARPAAAMVFLLAAITDGLDGYLARRLRQTSQFGAFLDPVADKLIVSTALILLVQADPDVGIALLAAIIIGREIAVSALREWMAGLGAGSRVSVSGYGKLKTIMQMTGLCCMLFEQPLFGLPTYRIGVVFLVVAAALTIWSMFGYIRAAWPAKRPAKTGNQDSAPFS